MESKSLFSIAQQGYDCAQVDEYIKRLRAEYKKVYDYAKAVESNNERLKKLGRSLTEENAALKAASTAAPAGDNSAVIKAVAELEKIAAELKATIK